uniref:Large ribosomal subunit protein uL30 N-terminal eukaryotes domain-containing protein n=1 Tax=Oxyrrhis marina TaxID=2969 RepID=A0A7S1CSD0_OXYMA|mmetsp:Transcript_71/g.89  ORF Transcript_71/g.89 Transcript_71/m.89 type:complete len:116 (+) Transcript_71:68-415(+)
MADRYLIGGEIEIPAQAPVPEGLKKKLDRNKKLLAEKEAAVAAKAKEKRAQRFALKMRTNAYEKEYKAAETKLIELRRQARREGSFFMEPDAKLMFVIRITGINKLAPYTEETPS